MSIKDKYVVRSIGQMDYKEWILKKHYAKRMPSISYAYGLFDLDGIVQAICTIGIPASPNVCKGVCGDKFKSDVYELNRLVSNENLPKNTLSYFVSYVLRILPSMILVSYADTGMNHNGYIYQATNFIYTGSGKPRTHMSAGEGKHPRHYVANNINREQWSPKHRYLYFIGNKTIKKHWLKALRYKVEPYPKGENDNYDASHKTTNQLRLL